MTYELPASCRDGITLCPPGHEPPPRSTTARGVVPTGPDSPPARVMGKPIGFPYRRFAPYEKIPPLAELRKRSKRVLILA